MNKINRKYTCKQVNSGERQLYCVMLSRSKAMIPQGEEQLKTLVMVSMFIDDLNTLLMGIYWGNY